ncbi:LLM class flavin-dependent oxidoreductase [Brevibacillus dissolubilis]|uniref:LLM class flavin-dependent oxidoreductase n=1 Tax=Brevibacillus dissolubilis TaxID=1844116 RepID=UPI0011179E62|nr:LLM class flavin-dependent oxidoreductase [Brevibacillus dissolubilis]
MRLSILDQSPVSSGHTAGEALQESMKLAQLGEALGYTRYWIAEHHDIAGLSCSAPEVMLGYIGAHTKTIRIGSGAVLLPNYKPYKVAETYNLLATLFPGRIDLGIGRAPGGSAEASLALTDNFLGQVRKMPESVQELLHFLHNDTPADHMYASLSASPVPAVPPVPWILGTSEKSAVLAAENGMAYAFGHFMSDREGPAILQSYRKKYQASTRQQQPATIVAVSVICAETTEQAEELALSANLWQIQLAKGEATTGIPSIEEAKQYPFTPEDAAVTLERKKKMVVGNPKEVAQQLRELQALYQADELMLVTITHSYEARLRSYQLIADEILMKRG